MKKVETIKIPKQYLTDPEYYRDKKHKKCIFDDGKGYQKLVCDINKNYMDSELLYSYFPSKSVSGITTDSQDLNGHLALIYTSYQEMYVLGIIEKRLPEKIKWIYDNELSEQELLLKIENRDRDLGCHRWQHRVVSFCLVIPASWEPTGEFIKRCFISCDKIAPTSIYIYYHLEECPCCIDLTGRIRRRRERVLRKTPLKFGHYIGIYSIEQLSIALDYFAECETPSNTICLNKPEIGRFNFYYYKDQHENFVCYLRTRTHCNVCHRIPVDLLKCPCLNAWYCSNECQLTDWIEHKKAFH